jgi:hypothetical protein
VVHAVPSTDSLPPGTCYADVVTAGRVLLQAEAARLSTRFPTLPVGTYLHCGDVVHALLRLSPDAALLVLGADRVDALTGWFRTLWLCTSPQAQSLLSSSFRPVIGTAANETVPARAMSWSASMALLSPTRRSPEQQLKLTGWVRRCVSSQQSSRGHQHLEA